MLRLIRRTKKDPLDKKNTKHSKDKKNVPESILPNLPNVNSKEKSLKTHPSEKRKNPLIKFMRASSTTEGCEDIHTEHNKTTTENELHN